MGLRGNPETSELGWAGWAGSPSVNVRGVSLAPVFQPTGDRYSQGLGTNVIPFGAERKGAKVLRTEVTQPIDPLRARDSTEQEIPEMGPFNLASRFVVAQVEVLETDGRIGVFDMPDSGPGTKSRSASRYP